MAIQQDLQVHNYSLLPEIASRVISLTREVEDLGGQVKT